MARNSAVAPLFVPAFSPNGPTPISPTQILWDYRCYPQVFHCIKSTFSKRTLSKPDSKFGPLPAELHLYLCNWTLSKVDSSFGPEGVRFRESWLYIHCVRADTHTIFLWSVAELAVD